MGSPDGVGVALMQDCCGVKRTLCVVLLQNILALGVTYLANTMQGESTDNEGYVQSVIDWVFLLAAFLLGCADNGIMTCIYAIISEKFGDRQLFASALRVFASHACPCTSNLCERVCVAVNVNWYQKTTPLPNLLALNSHCSNRMQRNKVGLMDTVQMMRLHCLCP